MASSSLSHFCSPVSRSYKHLNTSTFLPPPPSLPRLRLDFAESLLRADRWRCSRMERTVRQTGSQRRPHHPQRETNAHRKWTGEEESCYLTRVATTFNHTQQRRYHISTKKNPRAKDATAVPARTRDKGLWMCCVRTQYLPVAWTPDTEKNLPPH